MQRIAEDYERIAKWSEQQAREKRAVGRAAVTRVLEGIF